MPACTPAPRTAGDETDPWVQHDLAWYTWHVLSDLRGARLLWGLAYQRVPGTLVLIGPPLLDPNPFDAEPADPIALVPAMLTPLRAQAARQLRRRLPLGMPAGTVRWHTPGLAPAVTAWRRERDRPPGQRLWYLPPDARRRIDRIGGMLVLAASAQELKIWAVAVARLGDWLYYGMDYTDLIWPDGEVQVFTDYRRRVEAAQMARREVLAGPARQLPPADQRPLIWQRGTALLSRTRPVTRHDAVKAAL